MPSATPQRGLFPRGNRGKIGGNKGGPLKPRKPGFLIFYCSFRGREVFQCIRRPILVLIGGIRPQIRPSRPILAKFSSKTGLLDFPSPLVLGCVPRRGVFFPQKIDFWAPRPVQARPGLSRPGLSRPNNWQNHWKCYWGGVPRPPIPYPSTPKKCNSDNNNKK